MTNVEKIKPAVRHLDAVKMQRRESERSRQAARRQERTNKRRFA